MHRKKIIFLMLTFIPLLSFSAPSVSAESKISGMVDDAAFSAKYKTDISESELPETVGRFIKMFLSFLAVIFISLAVYAGYLWMTARDEEEKVNEAKDILQNAIIGIVIVVAAYAVTYFVIYNLASQYVKEGNF